MAIFPRPASPRTAWADMVGFVRERRRHQLVFAALAVAIPIAVIFAFLDEFNREKEWVPPPVIYMQQWKGDRTRAEMQAQQARDLPGELARKKRIADAEAKRRGDFQRLKAQLKSVGF